MTDGVRYVSQSSLLDEAWVARATSAQVATRLDPNPGHLRKEQNPDHEGLVP